MLSVIVKKRSLLNSLSEVGMVHYCSLCGFDIV